MLNRWQTLYSFSLQNGPSVTAILPRKDQLKKDERQIKIKITHLTNLFFVYSLHRYLASGDSLISLAFNFRLGHTTVMNSVHMVCAAIEKVMMQTFLPRPTADSWKEVAQRFWDKWNFPNCLGALDGKHIVIQAPPLSGSQYFNYKKTFSIVLLAHSWMQEEPLMVGCMQVQIWGGEWRTTF